MFRQNDYGKKRVIYGKVRGYKMGTTIRAEVSKKNKYWIEKHRYYELKHYCLQYPIWKDALLSIDSLSKRSIEMEGFVGRNIISNPTERCMEARIFYIERINIVEQTAKNTDIDLYTYIIIAVTEGVSYNYLKTKLDIPCCREVYYELYRKFFWLLNTARK